MHKHLMKMGEVTFDKIFNQKLGECSCRKSPRQINPICGIISPVQKTFLNIKIKLMTFLYFIIFKKDIYLILLNQLWIRPTNTLQTIVPISLFVSNST